MTNRILITIICLALSLGLGLTIVRPEYQDYRDLKSEAERKKTELLYHQQYFAELKEIDSRLKEYEVSLSKIENAFPFYFSVPAFFANLQRITSQSGLILDQVSKGSVQEKEKIKEHSFSLSLSGSLTNFKNLLFALENSAKLIEVENFSFSSPEEEEEPINFRLLIKTFSY